MIQTFPVLTGGHFTKASTTGLSIFQLPRMLAVKCSTVAEVKKELLAQHLVAIGKELHWLIADTQGNTTLFKADSKEGFIFTDEQPNRPFIITNYHL